LDGGNVIALDPFVTWQSGWMYLNLNTTVVGITYPSFNPSIAQAWVTTVMDDNGRFSAGFDAIKLDSACEPDNIVFIP
jgi:hypothetical protein